MARFIFAIFLVFSHNAKASLKMVEDVTAIAWLKNIAGQGSQMISNGANTLQAARQTTNTLFEMNNVLGGKLSSSHITKLNQFHVISSEFGCLLDSLNGSGDPLRELNYIARNYGGQKDMSSVIYAKEYFQNKFFPAASNQPVSSARASEVRKTRDEAADQAALNTLAIAKQQKASLNDDHKSLMQISNQAKVNDSVHYQANVQTQLLARIAASLEKLVLLQSQQLDFMAKMYLKEQPVAFTKVGGSDRERQ
jgi:hypothetical protein